MASPSAPSAAPSALSPFCSSFRVSAGPPSHTCIRESLASRPCLRNACMVPAGLCGMRHGASLAGAASLLVLPLHQVATLQGTHIQSTHGAVQCSLWDIGLCVVLRRPLLHRPLLCRAPTEALSTALLHYEVVYPKPFKELPCASNCSKQPEHLARSINHLAEICQPSCQCSSSEVQTETCPRPSQGLPAKPASITCKYCTELWPLQLVAHRHLSHNAAQCAPANGAAVGGAA